MTGHAQRKHAVLSPSGAHRWLKCTPSALLEHQFPDNASEAAREGTVAHELAELKLRNYFQTEQLGKTKFTRAVNKLKKDPLWRDEMQRHTDTYLDYVKGIALSEFAGRPTVAIEKQVPLETFIPHLEEEAPAAGTADCVLIGGGALHVIDFKYGKGVPVEAGENPQLSLYALGAYETCRLLYPVETVVLHIVQPRIREEASRWEVSLDDLLRFGDYVKKQATLAIKGEGDFVPSEETCRFCRARGTCRARAEKNVELAFAVGRKPPLISNEEMGEYLKKGVDVAAWLSDLKDAALAECLAGNAVPGWKAVEGRGSRDWTDMDIAFQKLEAGGIAEAVLWERKPLTLAQVEKAIGKKDFEQLVGEYVVKNPGKPTLVMETDNRPAITNKVTAAEAFKEE